MQELRAKETNLDWSELDREQEYRERMRRQTEEMSAQPVSWEDQQEKLLREKYIEMR